MIEPRRDRMRSPSRPVPIVFSKKDEDIELLEILANTLKERLTHTVQRIKELRNRTVN